MSTCKSAIRRDDDEPMLYCELDSGHKQLHKRGNTRWYDPMEVI